MLALTHNFCHTYFSKKSFIMDNGHPRHHFHHHLGSNTFNESLCLVSVVVIISLLWSVKYCSWARTTKLICVVSRTVGTCPVDDLWKTSQSWDVVVVVVVDVVVGSGCGLGGQGHSSKIGGLRGPLTHSWTQQIISTRLGGRISHRADLQIRAIGQLPALVCIAENIWSYS